LKQHALIMANRLNFLLRTRDSSFEAESAKARAEHSPETDPTALCSAYAPSRGNDTCPQCWVAGRGGISLAVQAQTDFLDVVKCASCGFSATLPRDAA
jgi:hypothetical protein